MCALGHKRTFAVQRRINSGHEAPSRNSQASSNSWESLFFFDHEGRRAGQRLNYSPASRNGRAWLVYLVRQLKDQARCLRF
jgi:hypothetical protein